MWKVGTLVQSDFKPEGFFFNHFNTKRKFHKCQFLGAFFKRDVLQYSLGLYALFSFKEHHNSCYRKLVRGEVSTRHRFCYLMYRHYPFYLIVNF